MFTMLNTQTLKRIQVPQEEIRIEGRNSEMEIHCVKPQILLHLNKVPTSIGFKRSIDLTISSKVRLLRSRQINLIKQARTIFQILEECFPSQFHQPKRREATVLGITHWIPKKLHSTRHKQIYNGVEDDSQFPHYTNTCNTN